MQVWIGKKIRILDIGFGPLVLWEAHSITKDPDGKLIGTPLSRSGLFWLSISRWQLVQLLSLTGHELFFSKFG